MAVGWSSDVLPVAKRMSDVAVIVPRSGASIWADLWVHPPSCSLRHLRYPLYCIFSHMSIYNFCSFSRQSLPPVGLKQIELGGEFEGRLHSSINGWSSACKLLEHSLLSRR